MGKKKAQRRRQQDEKEADDSLPEDFTIAGSIASTSVFWEDDNDNNNNESNKRNNDDDDLLIGTTVHHDKAALAAASRRAQLDDALRPFLGPDSFLEDDSAAVDNDPKVFATEKRTAVREVYWRRLFAALIHTPAALWQVADSDYGHATADALWTAAQTSLQRGAAAEQYAACRVLEAWAVVASGADSEDALDDWATTVAKGLHRVVQTASRATVVRSAALRAWTVAVWMGAAVVDERTDAVLDVCHDVAQPVYRQHPVPSALRATALDCWTVLATTLSENTVAGQDDVTHGRGMDMLPVLRDILASDNATDVSPDLKASAGETAAFIHECRWQCGDQDDAADKPDSHQEVVVANQQQWYPSGSWEGTEWEELVDEIRQSVADLANQSGHYMSKKAKKAQRATFREYLATLLDEEPPEQTVALRNEGSLVLTAWKQIAPLNFLRATLQAGLLLQLMTNATLQILFDVQAVGIKADGLSALEKRLYLSKASEASKEADRVMTKNRDKRERIKNHFLTVDGDEI